MLIGHRDQQEQFEQAVAGGRLHHAWLLAGPQGIGKRRYADWVAARLLGDSAMPLMDAGAHPDFRVLAPPETGKGSTTGAILVDQLRELADFLRSHPALGRHRVLIVDPIDAMNRSAANAFLKELEEPRSDSVFLLVSHAPGRLLPTIRSRCRLLRFQPLADADVRAVLESAEPDLPPAQVDALVALSAGEPGRALALARGDIVGLKEALRRAEQDAARAVALGRTFQGSGAAERFDTLATAVLAILARRAREQPSPDRLRAHAEAMELTRDAGRLAYDRPQVALALTALLARAAQD